jgi:CheY-like chemotaxis protein
MKSRVLLVEDDATMLTLLRTLLRIEGYETVPLENDRNADAILDTIRNEQPDVILLDVYLRQVNGLDILQKIRQDETIRDIGVIMSSGVDFSEQCLDLGANAFLLKPFMPDDLLHEIRELVSSQ